MSDIALGAVVLVGGCCVWYVGLIVFRLALDRIRGRGLVLARRTVVLDLPLCAVTGTVCFFLTPAPVRVVLLIIPVGLWLGLAGAALVFRLFPRW